MSTSWANSTRFQDSSHLESSEHLTYRDALLSRSRPAIGGVVLLRITLLSHLRCSTSAQRQKRYLWWRAGSFCAPFCHHERTRIIVFPVHRRLGLKGRSRHKEGKMLPTFVRIRLSRTVDQA